jgi:1-acyl-sn-glycerol-3-phosphate acyltransferase
LIFPEGTRTEKDALLNTFQRGAANIAIRANVPIRPILIKCTPSTLTKNEKWYHVPQERFHIQIKVLDALYIENVLDDTTVSSKQVKQLNQFLHNLFNQELSINEQLS